jgi:hypothetical protein
MNSSDDWHLRLSDTAMNAALAMIEAAAPENEIEAALAIQMACTHTAAMSGLEGRRRPLC